MYLKQYIIITNSRCRFISNIKLFFKECDINQIQDQKVSLDPA